MASVLACGGLPANAAASLPTNVLQTIDLTLTVISQGPAETNASGSTVTTPVIVKSVNSRDVISAIGEYEGLTFSALAQLLLSTPIDYTTNSITLVTNRHTGVVSTNYQLSAYTTNTSEIVVAEGTYRTNVTEFFAMGTATNISAESSTIVKNVLDKNANYRIENLAFSTPDTHLLSFTLQGFSVKSLTNTKHDKVTIPVYRENISSLIGATDAGVAQGSLSIGTHVSFE